MSGTNDKVPTPYEIVRPIAAGIVGRSFLVRNTETGKQAFCKVISHLEMSDHQWEASAFKDFHSKLQSINSPFFTPYFQITEHRGSIYAFREYVPGENLEQFLNTRHPNESNCNFQFALWKVIVRTVAHLHKNGVTLVGLRLHDIIVTTQGGVTITDVYPISSRLHFQANIDVQSFGLIAPEIFSGDKVTPAADIWSLGVLLVLMLTGKLPWKTENKFSIVRVIRSGVIDRQLIPSGVMHVISKTLIVNPERRINILSLLEENPSRTAKLPKLTHLPIGAVKPPSAAELHTLLERNRMCMSGRVDRRADSHMVLRTFC